MAPGTGGAGGTVVVAATGGVVASGTGGGVGTGGAVGTGGSAPTGLADRYPCDVGIENDASHLFKEDFEEASITAFVARYSDHNAKESMALVADPSDPLCGKTAGRFMASASTTTSNVFRQLASVDEIYYRAYVKYQGGVNWHHAGLSIKGYNPPSPWPLGLAGLRPEGDANFSLALEPVYGVGKPNPRFDVYAYWMKMRSWMDEPKGDSAYYGNSLVHRKDFTADDDTWVCVEVHLKLNTDLASSTGAVLELWRNDESMKRFDHETPRGCWIKDSFCPEGATGTECTDYPSLCSKPYVPADLQWRSSAALQITGIGFGNYITEGVGGGVQFDHVVVAKTRIGCIRH